MSPSDPSIALIFSGGRPGSDQRSIRQLVIRQAEPVTEPFKLLDGVELHDQFSASARSGLQHHGCTQMIGNPFLEPEEIRVSGAE